MSRLYNLPGQRWVRLAAINEIDVRNCNVYLYVDGCSDPTIVETNSYEVAQSVAKDIREALEKDAERSVLVV